MPPRRRRPPRPGALSDLPPLRILRAILLLQASYYSTSLILILFTTLVLGQGFTPSLILDWRAVRGDNTLGWVVGICWLLTGFITVIPMLILTTRLSASLVPDFALTIHFLHLLTTSFYTRRLPTNFLWWCLQASSAGLMVLLGVWVVRYREVKMIQGFGKRKPPASGAAGDGSGGGGGSRGGEYEMVEQRDRGGDENV
ncbi:uncharacterized protein HMPREF1541_01575 [Cyphellophora europaea CBS 101466]|uniref:Protein SYS1 n=1 Tax=Cyphellophora europaea (strain CBS 101466) TaxID=1220924 RepID=W2S1G9_CYPE1|nr:uncharacterized protein HMPREF1541_01575 [Cyphellophora europaea CBS 101466]ETN42420.1 hypothetical protein HMPREF1541_01575 [Cyphellophora europaea CBS 101466]